MRKSGIACDVAVIGAGLSGMLAAAAARQQGARVVLLADGHGALELSSGCIDLLGATPDGRAVERPWEALSLLEPGHPYSLLGPARVRAGLEAFRQICAEMDLPYSPEAEEENQWQATALGRLRPTYLSPPSGLGLKEGEPLWVVGIRSMPELHPEVVAAGLQQSLPGSAVTPVWADLPLVNGQPLAHPLQVARLLDGAEGRSALVRSLWANRPAGPAPAGILFPAVLGIDQNEAVRTAIADAFGAPVGEIPLLSPSVPGLRLAGRLRCYIEMQGVDLRMGLQVTGARSTCRQVEVVEAQSAGGPVEVRARAVVLATGGLLGRGMEPRGRHLQEIVFGLPVECPEPGQWAQQELLPAGGHAFLRAGMRTDGRLRPDGYDNLYVAGRALAGYDPYGEGSGGGVAIATGWYAGLLAGGVLQ